jgi:hypothetical protein
MPRFFSRLNTYWPRAREDAGQSLIMALVVMLVLVVSATTVTALIASNQNTSGRERQALRAFTAGEAGLDLAANAAVAAGSGGGPFAGAPVIDGSSVTWSATWSAANSTWTLNASAVSPNGKVTRVLQEKVSQQSSTGSVTIPAIYGYGFVMGGSPHTGSLTPDQVCQSPSASLPTTSFGGSGSITVPTWINGDVCITGGANPAIGNPSSGTIPVHIGGSLYVNGPNYAIGLPTGTAPGPVASVKVVGGCWSDFHGWQNPACDYTTVNANNGGSGVYASTYVPADPSPLPSKPAFTSDLAMWQNASPGPNYPCGASSTGTVPSNLFDTNAGSTSGPDSSLDSPAGTAKNLVQLLGTNAFDCITTTGGYPATCSVASPCELKWSPPAANGGIGQLTLNGTIFFDADLTMGGADYIKLMPNSYGSIYMDGSFSLTSDASICMDATTCNYALWSPDTDSTDPNIFFAAFNRSNATYGINMQNNSRFEGIVFTNGGFYLSNSSTMAGSVFADYATVAGAGTFQITNNVPTGTVGTVGSTSTTWAVSPGSWRECPQSGCS